MKTKTHISAHTHNTTPIHGRIWITFEMALDSRIEPMGEFITVTRRTIRMYYDQYKL